MPYSSNATFLVHVEHDGLSHPAIYKPMRGERPLWDFEPGLHRREVAAYLLSEALGIGVIPPTVLRDGPLGEGSVQWFVTADHRQHYFTIHEQYPELHDRLRAMALLDIIANNTDRKSGHCLLVPATDGAPASVWGIDQGLCFAPGVQAAHRDLGVRRRTDPRLAPRPGGEVVRTGAARDRRAAERRRGRSDPGPRAHGASRNGSSRPTRAAAAIPGRSSEATDPGTVIQPMGDATHRVGRRSRRADPSWRPRRSRADDRRPLHRPRLVRAAARSRSIAPRRRDRPPALAGGHAGRVPTGVARSGRVRGAVLDESDGLSGRFTIGPLTEVAAQHHTWDELVAGARPWTSGGVRRPRTCAPRRGDRPRRRTPAGPRSPADAPGLGAGVRAGRLLRRGRRVPDARHRHGRVPRRRLDRHRHR